MSKENVEIVRRIWEAADRRDSETALSLYDQDVELDLSGFPVLAAEKTLYRGHDGLRNLFGEWSAAWADAESELIELIDAGECVVCIYTYGGHGRRSGLPVEERFAFVSTVRDDKVIRVQWFRQVDEALEAAGLPE